MDQRRRPLALTPDFFATGFLLAFDDFTAATFFFGTAFVLAFAFTTGFFFAGVFFAVGALGFAATATAVFLPPRFFHCSAIATPSSAGERTVRTRAASSAANLSAAVPLPPET